MTCTQAARVAMTAIETDGLQLDGIAGFESNLLQEGNPVLIPACNSV